MHAVSVPGAPASVAVADRSDLVATGRRPDTRGLHLDSVGVTVGELGAVIVDDRQRSTNPRIWAAGDVTGGPQFVYVAAAQGTVVADNALAGADRALDYTAVPRVTFTSPAIAAVGMTEAAAARAGWHCRSRVLEMSNVPRALVDRDTRGLVKIVADAESGRILRVHAVADGAGDLITAATYAMTARLTVDQLAHTWAPSDWSLRMGRPELQVLISHHPCPAPAAQCLRCRTRPRRAASARPSPVAAAVCPR
ncbi:hypothetical protein NSK11_contig00077-0027 [Nocardia seriolae]|uniref:Dihydrolipoyl dehydrogenase n=1 Tax=Nocardia seriolae TaxID=37332 RepID=A0ABC9YZA8_9NOCA|nr:hypothetical protein NSK11_contig00077-0027 [Nocardia seriolae]